jgi:fructokinase
VRFVVCGEALVDLGLIAAENSFRSTWAALSAGGPMNTAVGLARLEETVEFCGRLSTDRFGDQLRAHLGGNGVGLGLATICADPTSLAVVSLDEQQRASYTFHFSGTANFGWRTDELPRLEPTDWLHVASLATVVEPGSGVLHAWTDQHTGPLSFDINVRPTVIADPLDYWSRVEPWLALLGRHHGVVKASDEDITALAAASGAEPGTDPTATMAQWQDRYGFAIGVVTLGPEGAWARAAERPAEPVRAVGRRVQVIDTVGAGDTFMAGFLAAWAGGAPLEQAMTQGVAAAAYVCTRQGPQPPSRRDLEAFVGS